MLAEAGDNPTTVVGRYAIREAANINQQQTPGTVPRPLSLPSHGHVDVRQDRSGRAEVPQERWGKRQPTGVEGDGEHSAVFVVLSQPSAVVSHQKSPSSPGGPHYDPKRRDGKSEPKMEGTATRKPGGGGGRQQQGTRAWRVHQ